MKTFLRFPADPNGGDQGSGSDNTGASLMDSWGSGDGDSTGGQQQQQQQPPQPRQVTPPPHRPASVVASDSQQTVTDDQQQQQSQQQTPPVTPPASQGLSDADLARIAATAAGAVRASLPQQQQPAQQQPAQMSDEEFATRYKTPRVDAAFMQQLMDTDPVKGAAVMNGVLKQTYTSALLMANDLFQAELAKVRQEFAPHVDSFKSFQAQQQKAQLENEFYSLHQDLASEREIVNETIDAFQAKVARGEVRFASKQEAFKAVADNVRKVLARMGASPNGGQHTPPRQPNGRQMVAATSQGRTSTGRAPNLTPMEKVMSSWDSAE